MSHSLYMTKLLTILPFSLIVTISAGRYNLWSYTSCRFLQYSISFSHKSLRPNLHCCQTQSTVFSQCHRPSITPKFMKILHKHTRLYFNCQVIRKQRIPKLYEGVVSITPNYFPFNFLILQSLFLSATTKYFKFPPFQNFKQCIR
jgi:hypothetical protein